MFSSSLILPEPPVAPAARRPSRSAGSSSLEGARHEEPSFHPGPVCGRRPFLGGHCGRLQRPRPDSRLIIRTPTAPPFLPGFRAPPTRESVFTGIWAARNATPSRFGAPISARTRPAAGVSVRASPAITSYQPFSAAPGPRASARISRTLAGRKPSAPDAERPPQPSLHRRPRNAVVSLPFLSGARWTGKSPSHALNLTGSLRPARGWEIVPKLPSPGAGRLSVEPQRHVLRPA